MLMFGQHAVFVGNPTYNPPTGRVDARGIPANKVVPRCTKYPGDGSKLEVPESIFVGWKQPKHSAGSALPLMAEDLLDLFEGFCAH